MTTGRARAAKLRCPACGGPVDGPRCSGCDRSYPTVAGLPDFRLVSDRYLGLDAERAKAERLARIAAATDLEGVARAYYAITPDVDPPRCERYLAHILGAESRGEAMAAQLRDDGPILEVGCGTGGLLAAASRRGLAIEGIDIAARWLVVARRRLDDAGLSVPLTAASADRLPFADATFGTVVADSLIEHCDDPAAALREWRRVLRPGGRLVLWSPNRLTLTVDPHVRLWGLGFLPRSWADRYVRLRRGGAWVPKTLTARGAARLARDSGFVDIAIGTPDIPPGWAESRPPLQRAAIRVYRWMGRAGWARSLLVQLGPIWTLEARCPDGPRPRPIPAVGRAGLAACLGAEVVAGALGFLATIHLARRLGPDGFARLEVAAATAGWLLVLVRGGLDQIVVREAARHPALIRRLTGQLIALRCLWAIVGIGLLAAIGGGSGLAIAAGLVLIPSMVVADVGPRARNELPFLACLQVTRAIGLASAVLWLVAGPGDLVRAAVAPAVAETLVALACFLRSARAGGVPWPRWSGRLAVVLSRRAAVAGLTRFGRVGLYAADAMALAIAAGSGTGAYAVGRRLVFALVAVGLVVPTLLAPGLARAVLRGKDVASAEVGRGLALVLGLFVPAALGLMLTADRLLPALFGPSYRDGAMLLGLVALRLPVLLVATWLQSALVSLGEEGRALRLTVGVALLAAVAVPVAAVGFGAVGIGAAILGVETVAAVGGWRLLRGLGIDPGHSVAIGPIVAGCLGLVAAVALTMASPLPITCIAGALGYGFGRWLLARDGPIPTYKPASHPR